MRSIYWLLASFAVLPGQAQHLPTAAPTWAVRLAPLSLLDPQRPTLQLGAEYFFQPYFSLGADIGTRVVLSSKYREPQEQRRHQTYRLEGRYYLLPTRRGQPFIAAEVFYVPYSYTSRNNLLVRSGNYFSYDQARVEHRTWGTALKYGWRYAFGGHQQFWVETAVGVGLRRKPARYSRILHEQPADSLAVSSYSHQEWRLGTAPPDGGHVDRLHVALSARIGYQFYRRAAR
jgi:hypothetical protein